MSHPSSRFVVEFRTSKIGPSGERQEHIGSGYLVAAEWVLTAIHVIDNALSVRAWIDPPLELTLETETEVDMSGIVRFARSEWALVPIVGYAPPPGFVPATFAILDRDNPGTIPASTIGLPSYRIRDKQLDRETVGWGSAGVAVREVLATSGVINPAGGGKTGALTMIVADAPDAFVSPDTAIDHSIQGSVGTQSIWEGMSGSAVWVGRSLVGIVARHELREGSRALTVEPVPDQNLTEESSPLPWLAKAMLVRSPANEATETYRQLAEEIAPAYLIQRDDELVAMNDFAAGAEQWWWWKADTFAGKTALTAWWASRQGSPDVTVVACFLSRTSGKDTADYLTRTWATQLGALAGRKDLWELSQLQSEQKGHPIIGTLINQAAQHTRKLILIVDGLDEYNPTSIPMGSWLPQPAQVPSNVAMIVTSRAGARDGIPNAHPLHRHIHILSPSEVGEEIRALAEAEIRQAVEDPSASLERRLLSYLSAAGASLRIVDLTTLINWDGWKADPSDLIAVWRTRLDRTIIPDPTDSEGLIFSHASLRESAREKLVMELPMRRTVLHSWAEGYARAGWPADTPAYLLQGYPDLLIDDWRLDREQLPRLVASLVDQRRHDRLRAVTGGDAAGLAQIASAIRLLTTGPSPALAPPPWLPSDHSSSELDLGALARLVWQRDRLKERNREVSLSLVSALAHTGHAGRAESLARGIPDPYERARAWTSIAAILVGDGRGESEVRRLTDEAVEVCLDTAVAANFHHREMEHVAVLVMVASGLTAAGQIEKAERVLRRAEQVADVLEMQYQRAPELIRVASALAEAGRSMDAVRLAQRAERLAGGISRPSWRAQSLVEVASILARLSQGTNRRHLMIRAERAIVEAERAAMTIEAPELRTPVLISIVRVLSGIRKYAWAKRVATRAERAAMQIGRDSFFMDYSFIASHLVELADALRDGGLIANARSVALEVELLADRETHPQEQLEILIGAATAMLACRQQSEGERIALRAESLADRFADPQSKVRGLSSVATIHAGVGQYTTAFDIALRAEGIVKITKEFTSNSDPLLELAVALLEASRQDASASGQAAITQPHLEALVRIATALEQPLQATAIQQASSDSWSRGEAVAEVAGVLARGGHSAAAERFAIQAERMVVAPEDPVRRKMRIEAVIRMLSKAGRTQDAEEVAAAIADPSERTRQLALICASDGRIADAERILDDDVDDPRERARMLGEVLIAAIEVGYCITADDLSRLSVEKFRLRHAANALLERGGSSVAESIAAMMDDADEGVSLLIEIAKHHLEAGLPAEAARVAGVAESAAIGIDSVVRQVFSLAEVGRLYADVDREADAIRIALEIEGLAANLEDDEDTEWFEDLRRDFAGPFGTRRGALKQERRARALGDASELLLWAGRTAEAERVARTIELPGERAMALGGIAGYFTYRGRGEETDRIAVDLPAAIPQAQWRARVILEAIKAHLRAGQTTESVNLAGTLEELSEQQQAWTAIAAEYLRTGRAAEAEHVAHTIDDVSRRWSILLGVVRGFADLGDNAEAERVADEIDAQEVRTGALQSVAHSFASQGDSANARRLVAKIWAQSGFTTSVPLTALSDAVTDAIKQAALL